MPRFHFLPWTALVAVLMLVSHLPAQTAWLVDAPPITTFPTPVPTPTPTPTVTPTPTATPSWIDPLIIDNPEAEFMGDWTVSAYSVDRYGNDYRFTSPGDGSNFAVYRPNLPLDGDYVVSEMHSSGSNRTTDAELLIFDGVSTQTLRVNQQQQSGIWVELGTYSMRAGTECYVIITNNVSDTGVIMADAIKFAYVNTVPSPTPTATPTPYPTPTSAIRPFGEYVQQVIDELEERKVNDTSGYLHLDVWGKYTGVTETLWYQNSSYMWNECAKDEAVVHNGNTYYPYGKSYCSGLTLEIFHRAMKKRDAEFGLPESEENWNGLGTKGIFIIKKLWNVIKIRYSDTGQYITNSPCPAEALALSGIGEIITMGDESKFEDVRRYDFCDLSRTTGGHSVIFLEWIRAQDDNRIIGLKYYSTGYSTNGQGESSEYFEGEGGSVLKNWFRAGRVYDHPSENTVNQIREVGYTN